MHHNTAPDTAHVLILPQLLYGAAFLIGLLLHWAFPVHILPPTLARGIGVVCMLVQGFPPMPCEPYATMEADRAERVADWLWRSLAETVSM